MKFKNLSVKRLFGRVAMGLVLSMSGITIAWAIMRSGAMAVPFTTKQQNPINRKRRRSSFSAA